MKRHLALIISSLALVFSPFSYAEPSYVQEGLVIKNLSSYNILITDPAISSLTNYNINAHAQDGFLLPTEQLTNPAGQTFTHTVQVVHATTGKIICTIKTNLFLSQTSTKMTKAEISDPELCEATNSISSYQGDTVFAFIISVKEKA